MDPKKMPASRLMVSSVLEPRDEIDEKLERAYNIIHQLTNGFTLSERESNDTLQTHVAKGQAPHDETVLGLFYSILVDPKTAVKCYRDMAFVARDGLLTAISKTNQLVHEKWTKLLDTPRTQLLWFSKELVRSNNRGAESVCHTLIRQIAGGDISLKNIWLTEAVLDILAEHRAWLDKHPPLIAGAIYTYLRVIVDHTAAPFEQLKQRETDFCVSLLRDKWTEALVIGRDLVRLLQYVARIPEFDKLWKDILHNPTALSPTFTGIPQLMMTRTPRWLIASRLTPDMENKLVFLTTKVRFGQQKRYQDWFQRQYLATPESQSLRWDLIRYICAVIHPSNEVLCSEIIPRWAVIGWLLTTCTSNVAASNAKLSLFYDWLYFDPEKDSIMNIEPCILVMHHSMRPHPAITATLLDFMCRIMFNFYPPYITRVKQGIFTALRTILEKRVLPSLSPLFDNPKLDKDLRVMIRENFIEFCSQEVKDEPAMGNNNVGGSGAGELGMEIDPSSHLIDGSMMLDIAEFSDEEEEDPAPDIKQQPEIKFRPIKESIRMATVDISEHLIPLDPEIRQCVIDFKEETENEIQCEMMDRLVQAIISCHVNQGEYDQEMAAATAMCLTQLLAPYFTGQLYPTEPDEESIEDSIGSPLYVIFRNVCQTPEDDPARQPILILLEEMYLKQPRLGYHFLYFLKVSKVHDEKMAAYRDFCNSMENKDIATCLMDDLRYCAGDDVRLFTFLIPDVYTLFPNIAIGNTDMLQLIVSHIDGTQLQDLVCQILQGHLIMFRKDSFLNVLNASLEWETIEQYFLWQLISAHSIPVEHIMPILPKLEFNTHAEALASVLVLLKQDGPCGELMRPLLCRECKKYDLFTVSILKFWAQEYEDKLADLLYAQLTRSASTPNRKRKGSQSQSTPKMKDKDAPTVEQVLAHLEHMRQTCRNISFLMHESLQQGLQHVQVTATESLKNKFSELLALAEDIDDYNRNTRVLRAVPSRRASSAAGHLHAKVSMPPTSSPPKKNKVEKIDSDSETSSSDDEEIMRPPKAKKRKKVIAVDDDSD